MVARGWRVSICSSRWLGLEGESGLGEEPVGQGRPVMDALEPVLDDRSEHRELVQQQSAATAPYSIDLIRPVQTNGPSSMTLIYRYASRW